MHVQQLNVCQGGEEAEEACLLQEQIESTGESYWDIDSYCWLHLILLLVANSSYFSCLSNIYIFIL